jgi:hypothetical protein
MELSEQNNPTYEMWNQAKDLWGEQLENKVKVLVSIGTGIPSIRSFCGDMLHIGGSLVAIATETENTAERFRRDKSTLDNDGRYFRFNVVGGVEDVGLEESKKKKEIASYNVSRCIQADEKVQRLCYRS